MHNANRDAVEAVREKLSKHLAGMQVKASIGISGQKGSWSLSVSLRDRSKASKVPARFEGVPVVLN